MLCWVGAVLAPQAHAQPGSFLVEIGDPGTEPRVLKEVLEVGIDDIVVDYRTIPLAPADFPADVSAARQGSYRLYGPGAAHWGSARLSAALGGADSRELYQWWLDCSQGKNIRKSISVIALKRDGSEARRYNLLDCFPTRWDPGEYSPSLKTQTETLTVSVGRIELTTRASDGSDDESGNVLLDIDAAETGGDVDGAWETWSGGEPMLIPRLTMPGAKYHTSTPGHKSVGEVTLRGPLTSGRKALCQWITETVQGKPWKRTVTVKEITKDGGAGKMSYNYFDCFPTRYVFPAFSASGTGNLYEEVHIKPIRLELQ